MSAIATDWKSITIEECCEILDNKRKPLNSAERLKMQGDVPYYGANGVVDHINDFIFDEDLILVAEDGGNFSDFRSRPIAYKVSGKSWVNNHAHILRAKPNFHQDFIFYSLEHKDILLVLNGGTRAKLNKSELEKLEIHVPNLFAEQQKIAAIFATVDKILDVIARQIAATRTLKRGLMQRLFSRGVGTQDAAGRWVPHNEFKDSELGKIPAEWKVVTLESIADAERGRFSARPRNDPRYFDGGDFPFIQTGDIASATRFIERASQFLNTEGLGVSKVFPAETIFITIAANIGDVAISKISMACPDSVVGIVSKRESCNNAWLYYLLGNSKDYFDSRATQNAQKNINLQVLKPFLIPLPTMEEQKYVADVLTGIDDKLDVLSAKQAHYQKLKRGLMQKLLTGEWRVKFDTPVEEAIA